jgi:aryl-alcohol dehydrogenase-like predicted oxidoreductase
MKLGIGTAQFGLDYGIANRTGKASREHAVKILDAAARSGVGVIDTAPSYGSSEQTLGEILPADHAFRLVTKTVPFDRSRSGRQYATEVKSGFRNSLRRLRMERTYALLVHHAPALLSDGADDLMRALEDLKAEGSVARIGVSVYHPRELEMILDRFTIDLVQLPFNLYDQRFAQAGWLTRLKQRRVEVHARSVFLQGLLLMPPERLPEQFGKIAAHHERLHRQIADAGLTPLAACLSFCLEQADIDQVIVGCEVVEQFNDILDTTLNGRSRLTDTRGYSVNDESIINPSRWSE